MSQKIIVKYIKDLDFNIPNHKTFFLLSKHISKSKINIDIKSSQAKQNIIEVLTSLSLSPTKENLEGWFNAGVTWVGMGSKLIAKDSNGNYDYKNIENMTREAIQIIEDLRN